MEKNIPSFITLLAGMIACICCFIYNASYKQTVISVLITLIVFYIIGRIVYSIVVKINASAEEADKAAKLEEAKKKQEEDLEQHKEEIEKEAVSEEI